jgi:phosphonoacetaldehyde hydrolase
VLEVLDKLRAQGILIGSTTGYVGSMMEILYPEAQKFGLYVDSLVHSSDCKEGRPSPFMIFRNMENLGIYDVEEIIKVGDTVADMKEGLNAGTWTVGITKSGNEVGLSSEDWLRLDALQKEDALNKASDKLMEAGAHFVVDDLEEVIEIIQEINLILATEKD